MDTISRLLSLAEGFDERTWTSCRGFGRAGFAAWLGGRRASGETAGARGEGAQGGRLELEGRHRLRPAARAAAGRQARLLVQDRCGRRDRSAGRGGRAG